jgi:endogenous inhibitor of DNA gyrase (YacG/DUF329 family)
MEGQSTAEWPEFPFCSRRCKTIDLGRWLGDDYLVPAEAEGGNDTEGFIDETEVP